MENFSGLVKEHDQMDLPPGFRFHPTDEELITHYLSEKVVDCKFSAKAIGEVDMNRIEPWDLPRLAKLGEKEWYFFCLRDKKYPTGLRTNRATAAGYWKATGKDKEIFRRKSLVGMKKTLVFYKGRAPKGEKTNWVIHEFRLEGKLTLQNLPKSAKNEWVICRVFHKSSGEKKIHISGMMMMNSSGNELVPSSLPPLMDSIDGISELHVPCFSNPIDIQTTQKDMINSFFNNPVFHFNSNSNFNPNYPKINPIPDYFLGVPSDSPVQCNFQFNDQGILRGLIENYGQSQSQSIKQSLKMETEMVTGSQDTGLSSEMNTEISVMSNLEMGKRRFEDHEAPSTSVGPIDLDSIWNY